VLKRRDIKMIHKWLKEGMSKSAIAKRLGISRETVRKYANKPEGYISIIAKAPTENLVDEYLPHVGHMLEVARANKVEIPTTVIYDEIVKLGYLGSLRWLQQVMQRYDLRKRVKEEEQLIRFETEPAQQMQVDWIEFPKDNLSAFVATMGYSRASYVEYVQDETLETLIICHLNAFNYFGGVPKESLYDNMRTVITKRNAYGYGKHQLNSMFEDFAKHCGFKIRVCKPYRAKTKGKVERFNHYLRYSFHNSLSVRLAMKRYSMNIDNANAEVLKWLDDVANKRIHQTTLQTPFALLAEERYHLLSLPKPYMGIHPKAVNVILAKNSNIYRATQKIRGIYIPNRDMQSYDAFIPSLTALVALSYAGHSMNGATLWN
jgi:transposase